jgi:hypothetical protein
MVRPDLRRDMTGIPEICPQERERSAVPRGNVFTTGGPQSLVGNPVPEMGASQDLALGFQGNERSQLCMQAGLTERGP